ncbi:MAG: TIGR02611 family protein [Mycobacteriaceae bacterium]
MRTKTSAPDQGGLTKRLKALRASIAQNATANFVYRTVVGVVGCAVLAVGIVAIPYPGPGWLIVFAGLAILASEFSWAQHLLGFVRARYDRFMGWFSAQGMWVKALGIIFTTVIVLLTLWVLGALNLMASWVSLDWSWLKSPLGI